MGVNENYFIFQNKSDDKISLKLKRMFKLAGTMS